MICCEVMLLIEVFKKIEYAIKKIRIGRKLHFSRVWGEAFNLRLLIDDCVWNNVFN